MSRISITSGASAGNKRRAATNYGAREVEDTLPSKYAGTNGSERYEITFNFDDLPGAGLDEANLRIPQGAFIKTAKFKVHEAFVGGTNVSAGLINPDGTSGVAAGLMAAVASAALLTDATIVGGGALVGTSIAVEKQLTCTSSGTYTAGKATLSVEFEASAPRA